VDLGWNFSPSFRLAEFLPEPAPPVLLAALAGKYDAAWVVGRLPPTFGVVPDLNPHEKTLFRAGFVALPEGSEEAVAFHCCDFYGVAAAFWSLLLLEPEILQDFEAKVVHAGAPVTFCFGCEDGEPYYYEIPD
jgi:hypothetical protein